MTTWQTSALAAVLFTAARTAQAQQPPRLADAARTDPSRSVTLSLTEYNRLIDLAARPLSATPGPPVPALLASADLRVRVDRDRATGVFTLAGEVLRPGIARVTLIAGATLTDANADGRPLPLIADGQVHSALVPGPGPFNATLRWGTPLTTTPGRASFVLPVPASGTARATIDLPGEQADVHVSAGVITGRAAANGRTVVDVTLHPNTPTEISWSMRDSAPIAAAREVRMLADVYTLVTLGDADMRMAALVDATVVQGDARTLAVRLPAGYELTGVSGTSIEASLPREGGVVLTVTNPAARRLQFLVTLERAHVGGSFNAETDFIALPDVQRERGEIAIEGVGTLELDAAERAGMHRMDVRELNPSLQSLARLPLLAAYRYQRTVGAPVALALRVQRFPDAGVLAAVADRASATTLITSEGRALTEVSLQIRNRAQPFLKVTLPEGAAIVSVDVAGAAAKPVLGADGTRVPLLRPGFRPNGPYTVSYVYMHAGTPFAKKGELPMALPKMDIPVGMVEWELFVPDSYRADAVGGNVIERTVLMTNTGRRNRDKDGDEAARDVERGTVRVSILPGALTGQIHGRVTDWSGAVLPGVTIVLTGSGVAKTATTQSNGTFMVTGLPTGAVTVSAELAGFQTQRESFMFDQRPTRVDFVLTVGSVAESVSVTGASRGGVAAPPPPAQPAPVAQPSQNVLNLQKRTAGVLPIRIDVPKAGTSHQFVKPLVVDQEATVLLRYKRR